METDFETADNQPGEQVHKELLVSPSKVLHSVLHKLILLMIPPSVNLDLQKLKSVRLP